MRLGWRQINLLLRSSLICAKKAGKMEFSGWSLSSTLEISFYILTLSAVSKAICDCSEEIINSLEIRALFSYPWKVFLWGPRDRRIIITPLKVPYQYRKPFKRLRIKKERREEGNFFVLRAGGRSFSSRVLSGPSLEWQHHGKGWVLFQVSLL